MKERSYLMASTSWYPVIYFPLSTHLQPLIAHLQQSNIHCCVTEDIVEGCRQQQIWVSRKDKALEVAEVCLQWCNGELDQEIDQVQLDFDHSAAKQSPLRVGVGLHLLALLPITLGIIVLGFVGAALVNAERHTLSHVEPFLFQGLSNDSFVPLSIGLQAGEYWRFVTPIFIHFNFLHILVNSLIMWEVGRRIELGRGSLHYLGFILMAAVVSNYSQYISTGDVPFGGLSGVAYAAIGYIAVYQELVRDPVLRFHKGAIAFFIIWLLLGVFGIIDLFIVGSIANAAHISGLIIGAIFGGLVTMIDKAISKGTNE